MTPAFKKGDTIQHKSSSKVLLDILEVENSLYKVADGNAKRGSVPKVRYLNAEVTDDFYKLLK